MHCMPLQKWNECTVRSPQQLWPSSLYQTLPSYAVGERGGSVVECRTPEREVGGSRPTAAVLCLWARHFTPRKYWLITQEAVAPSRCDWKIVDWDVKPQHKQNKQTKPPMQLPGHQSITPSVAMTTQLWCHSVCEMAWHLPCSWVFHHT